jgi:hypothetical protein
MDKGLKAQWKIETSRRPKWAARRGFWGKHVKRSAHD